MLFSWMWRRRRYSNSENCTSPTSYVASLFTFTAIMAFSIHSSVKRFRASRCACTRRFKNTRNKEGDRKWNCGIFFEFLSFAVFFFEWTFGHIGWRYFKLSYVEMKFSCGFFKHFRKEFLIKFGVIVASEKMEKTRETQIGTWNYRDFVTFRDYYGSVGAKKLNLKTRLSALRKCRHSKRGKEFLRWSFPPNFLHSFQFKWQLKTANFTLNSTNFKLKTLFFSFLSAKKKKSA